MTRQPPNRSATRRPISPMTGHLLTVAKTASDVTDRLGPLTTVLTLADLHRVTGNALRAAVDEARAAGVSWTDIGAAIDLSKQGAQQRYRATNVD